MILVDEQRKYRYKGNIRRIDTQELLDFLEDFDSDDLNHGLPTEVIKKHVFMFTRKFMFVWTCAFVHA